MCSEDSEGEARREGRRGGGVEHEKGGGDRFRKNVAKTISFSSMYSFYADSVMESSSPCTQDPWIKELRTK